MEEQPTFMLIGIIGALVIAAGFWAALAFAG
jgi:hypothetical protein